MTFQTPRSVEEMLTSIHKRDYLMPAIQREFVWGPEQIVRLVDSLMRGYPVGSFLLWEVQPATAQSYTFYEFLTHFHEQDNPFADKATVLSGSGTTAVLDGQQRLTSLNIALYGSFAEKKKYAWWNSTDAFPVKRLYLNLAEDPDDEELGLHYNLKFLTDKEAATELDAPDNWFRVGNVLDLQDSGPAIMNELASRRIVDQTGAFGRLYHLYQAVRVLRPMNYFLVTDQDPDKVLEIFVRVNSGGTSLSYSDLLLSMATNQWKELDAREEVRSLVGALNGSGGRHFSFSKDIVSEDRADHRRDRRQVQGLELHSSEYGQGRGGVAGDRISPSPGCDPPPTVRLQRAESHREQRRHSHRLLPASTGRQRLIP